MLHLFIFNYFLPSKRAKHIGTGSCPPVCAIKTTQRNDKDRHPCILYGPLHPLRPVLYYLRREKWKIARYTEIYVGTRAITAKTNLLEEVNTSVSLADRQNLYNSTAVLF